MKRHLVAILTAVIVLTAPQAARSIVYLDITSAYIRKLSLAIPAFVDPDAPDVVTEKGRKMADLVAKALTFHGFVSVIPATAYRDSREADWSALGVDYVVLGTFSAEGEEMVLTWKLQGPHNRMIAGKRYRASWSMNHAMLLRLSNDIVFQFTGEEGISNTKIAFVSDATGHKEIYLADVLGDTIRRVTRNNSLAIAPRFSPDGRWLAYTSYLHGNPDLYVTDLLQDKTTRAISWQKGLNMTSGWSPDGQTMITTLTKEGTQDLYLMSPVGRILDRLTYNEGISVSASWAPDGKRFAFVSDRTGKPQIYIMDIDTRKVHRLTWEGTENTTPSWSPKGDLIAYTSLTGNGHHIFTISPDGGEPTQVTRYWGNYESPSWSPDGRQLVLSRGQGEQMELCRVFLNAPGVIPFFAMKGSQSYPQWSPRLNY